MSVQESTGTPLTIGDFVKFPNPNYTTKNQQTTHLIGVYCGPVSSSLIAVNVPATNGTSTTFRSVVPSQCIQLISINGPENQASNK